MSTRLDTSWVDRGRVPCLDGYRGVGTILIVFGHSTRTARTPVPVPEWLYQTVQWGDVAVHLFFALSGFLITLLLLREFGTHGNISLRGFYRRRVLRIMPAYWAYLAVLFLLCLAGVVAITGDAWRGALTYSINFHLKTGWELGHFWTLSVEEHFYFVWPAVLALAGLTGARWLLAACILLAPVLRYVSNAFWSRYLNVDYCTFNHVDLIAFGAALAFLCRSEKFCRLTERLHPVSGWLLIGAWVGLAASSWLSLKSWRYDLLAHRTVTGFLCAAVIYLSAASPNRWVRRVLDWRPLVSIGVVSYSVYIWQQLFTGRSALPPWFSTWPTNLLCIAAAGLLSYFLVERPFMRIKDRKPRTAAARPEAQPAPPAANSPRGEAVPC
jgi:peptidoglycan/LPS O-acetylase OafA/YrhL